MSKRAIVPVIICGGSGSRLWPLSRQAHPKPFVRLPDDTTLIGRTYERACSIPGVNQICTVTNQDHFFLALDCYRETGIENVGNHFLLEPVGRNTAPAIAAATLQMQKTIGDDAILLVLPADHMIDDMDALNSAFAKAFEKASDGKIVTFGITPSSPETGYGYIEMDGEDFVCFVEKPDLETAKTYANSGKHFWNSGMFCFSVATMMEAMRAHCPEILEQVDTCLENSLNFEEQNSKTTRLDSETFTDVSDISIDYAIMERTDRIACITTDCGWSDIGSWAAFADFYPTDENGNQITGEVVSIKTSNCIVDAGSRFAGLIGVKDLIVVDTQDAILIANKNNPQDVKDLYSKLLKEGHESAVTNPTVHRPWGTYTVIEEGNRFKIKRIVVKPGARLSLQSHHHRSEHWVVVSGTAKVVNGDKEVMVMTNESTYIPCGNTHRMENPGVLPLVLIEVQIGDYLGEDDIVRYDDVYGRA